MNASPPVSAKSASAKVPTAVSSASAGLRVLFLARRYPPSRGGAQTHAYKLFTYLDSRMQVDLVALRAASVVHLSWFMPWALIRAVLALLLRRVDVIYFSDGVTASLAAILRPIRGRARFCNSLFGLEMTFGSRLAQSLMRRGTMACDGIAVISDNSIDIAERVWNIQRQRMRLIYLGAEPEELTPDRDEALRRAFEAEQNILFGRDRVVLNLGRQVPRKGMAAFIEHGVPLLADDIRLLVVGGGPDADKIRIARSKLANPNQVILLGVLDDDTCSMLRRHCDLFLMPNVETDGDVEGFGIAPLEAMYLGTPVVAFAVDALVEAVREGGWLIQAGDYQAFANSVHGFYDLTASERQQIGESARAYCLRDYGWDTTSSRYADLFEELCRQ
jgi:glycosyltransferase involved in cell wall biosynthesis